MKYNQAYDDQPVADVPSSAVLKVIRLCKQEEDDQDMIEWSEIQQLMYERDWGPILALPLPPPSRSLPRMIDENGDDVSAFTSADFHRLHGPGYDRFGYALDYARRERDRALWMMEMLFDRIPGKGKYAVLRYLKEGVIDESMIVDHDMQRLLYWRWRKQAAQQKIERIEKARGRCGGR